MADQSENKSQILFYQTEDGQTRLDVRLLDETGWLSLNQLAELFQRDKSVISKHIKNVFDERELDPTATVAKFATVQKEGDREVSREIECYNLDVIISVGYRVKSTTGTQFRIWATSSSKHKKRRLRGELSPVKSRRISSSKPNEIRPKPIVAAAPWRLRD